MTDPGILFKGVIKKINKKRTWIYRVIEKKIFEIEILQFPSISFQILNCYMIVYYEYLLPIWVAMTILYC